MLKALCEQFLFSNRVIFWSRTHLTEKLQTVIEYKNVETEMVMCMVLTGVIPKLSTDPVDLIPVLGCVTEVRLYKASNAKSVCINKN